MFFLVFHPTGLDNIRELYFNPQDKPDYYMQLFRIMFPPSFLNNRVSAHYLEINQIVFYEMAKKFRLARQEIANDRRRQTHKVKCTKYITNPHYVYPK